MRQTISGEHKKIFHQKGWLGLEEAISPSEVKDILKAIEKNRRLLGPSGKVVEMRFPSRSIPQVLKLLRRKDLAEIVFEIFAKKPLRISWDLAFHILLPASAKECSDQLNAYGSLCGMLIPLEGDNVGTVYLCTPANSDKLPLIPSLWHLVLVFTTAPLDDQNHPIVYR